MAIGAVRQPEGRPAVECGGALVCCQVIKWQPEVAALICGNVQVEVTTNMALLARHVGWP